MPTLLLVRHGETDWNAGRRIQGQTDVPLNDKGLAQAQAAANYLKPRSITAIYSSDLLRAWRTAEIIGREHPVEIQPDKRLREMHFGIWEGKNIVDIREEDPERHERWLTDPEFAPDGAETVMQMVERIGAFMADIRETHNDEQEVLLVAHGGTLQILVGLAIGLNPQLRWRFQFANASLTELYLFKNKASIAGLNIKHYLDGIGEGSISDAKVLASR